MNLRRSALLLAAVSLLSILSGCGGARGTASAGAAEAPLVGDPARGKPIFRGTCALCHGNSGTGTAGMPKDLTRISRWMKEQTDADLVEYIKKGRLADDPLNTTRIEMPARGGNPDLTDQDLADVVAYLRVLQSGGR